MLNNKKKKIIEYVVYVVVFFLIAFGTPKVLGLILDTDYPIASITSSSMWPELRKGDLILIRGARKEDIKIGDVVVYANENSSLIVHRVIKLRENDFITRGDANNTDDKPVEYERLVGKVLKFGSKQFKIPYLGKVSGIINKKN